MMEVPDLLEQLDQMVHLVKLVPLDLREILVTKDHKEMLVLLVPLVTQEPKVLKERKEKEVYAELMELRVLRETKVVLDYQVTRDQLELLVRKENQDQQEHEDLKDLRDLKDPRELRAIVEQPDKMDSMAFKVIQVMLE